MFEKSNQSNYLYLSDCCPQFTWKEAYTWWPRPKQDNDLIPNETLELALKWFKTRFKFSGFNYKVSKKTNHLTLLQLLFTHGVKGPVMKTKNETEDNVESAFLKDGQYIASQKRQRVDQVNVVYSFIDQNSKVFLSFLQEFPIDVDSKTIEIDSFIQIKISEQCNFLTY